MSEVVVCFVIPGKPHGQGSMQLSRNPKTGKEFVKYPPATVSHRNLMITVMAQQWGARPPLDGPLAVRCDFRFPRPKHHFRTGANALVLRDDAPEWHTTPVDIDKAARLVNDALTISGVIVDDARVVMLQAVKRYSDQTGTTVEVIRL
jgi:Holliday junction resolvase RusA-like endonuclease